jgi:ANTAR domain
VMRVLVQRAVEPGPCRMVWFPDERGCRWAIVEGRRVAGRLSARGRVAEMPGARLQREVTLGTLNLLSAARAPMDEADVIVARAFADLATLSITQHRASAEAHRLNEQLSAALTSRVVIEQAKGVLVERAGVDLAEAFARLRAYARNGNLRLTDVARAVIDGTLDPAAWARPARPVPS